MVFGLLFRTQ